MDLDIWVVGTLNQLIVIDSYTEIEISKNKSFSGKTPFFVKGQFCIPHSIYLNISF